jgi:predicted dienelactone hydrolase
LRSTIDAARRHALRLAGLAWSVTVAAGAAGPLTAARAEAPARAVDGQWLDSERQRAIDWRARWPAGEGPCACVLYSHGLGGSHEGGDAWGEAWRTAGVAVLHLRHAGSDSEALRSGWRGLRHAASAEQLAARARDTRFVMDEIARRARGGEAPWLRVRCDALGVAGHSFGAHTTQALAGQRYRAAADLFADARPRAFIALSPSPGRGEPHTRLAPAEAFGGITRPFLAVTGSRDGDPFGSFDDGDARVNVYRGLPAGQRALLWLDGADHMTFAGNAERRIRASVLLPRDRRAERDEPRHHGLVARVTSLWWRAQLLGDAGARAELAAAPASLGLGAGDRFEFE